MSFPTLVASPTIGILAHSAAMPQRHDIAAVPPSAPTAEPASLPAAAGAVRPERPAPVREIGGASGPEPTRYGDWERAGRCIDF
jgi:hypothetical protein